MKRLKITHWEVDVKQNAVSNYVRMNFARILYCQILCTTDFNLNFNESKNVDFHLRFIRACTFKDKVISKRCSFSLILMLMLGLNTKAKQVLPLNFMNAYL